MVGIEQLRVTEAPHESWDDARLAASAAAGDRHGFRLLYERHRLAVFRYLVRWLGDTTRAEDVLQESFLQVYAQLERYDRARPFRGWLFGVVRNVAHSDVWRSGDLLVIDIQANAFLHHMVRNIAGCLLAVGDGRRPVDWLAGVLAGRDRTRAAATAPAQGLYLVDVAYPAVYQLPPTPYGPLLLAGSCAAPAD